MTSGLWPSIQDGNAAAVSAGVRVSERRSRLLGLDAPVVTKGELTGSLGIYAERLAAERELFAKLDVAQLEELAAASQALVDRAAALVAANTRDTQMPVSIPSAVGGVPTVVPVTRSPSLPDLEVTDAAPAQMPSRTEVSEP
jgi:hypothetical protein